MGRPDTLADRPRHSARDTARYECHVSGRELSRCRIQLCGRAVVYDDERLVAAPFLNYVTKGVLRLVGVPGGGVRIEIPTDDAAG